MPVSKLNIVIRRSRLSLQPVAKSEIAVEMTASIVRITWNTRIPR
jgi:hypothetical protein